MARQWTVVAAMLLTALLGARAAAANVAAVSTTDADGIYGLTQLIDVTVLFDANVTVTGVPKLILETGSFDEPALYTSTDPDGRTLHFQFTTQSGDRTSQLECVSSAALQLNGGSINETAGGAPANRTLPIGTSNPNSLSGSHLIVIDTDGTKPTVKKIWSPSGDGIYGKNKSVLISVQFSEPVAVTGASPPTLTLNSTGTGATASAILLSGQFTDTLTFTYTPLAGHQAADLDVAHIVVPSGSHIADADGDADTLDGDFPAGGVAGALNYNNNIVVDTVDPKVTSVDSTVANGAYGLGSSIPIRVFFDKTVTVTGGTPTITLQTGSSDTVVGYVSGSGSNILVFNYLVGPGQNSADLEYIPKSGGLLPLSPNGATIRDAASNDADLTTIPDAGASGSLGSNKDIVIDTQSPSVLKVTASEADGTYTSGQIHVQVVFDEPVAVTGTPTITLATNGAVNEVASYASGSGTSTLTFIYTILPGDSSPDLDYVSTTSLATTGATIKDLVGNAANTLLPAPGSANSLAGQKAIVVTTPPAVLKVDSGTANGTKGPGTAIDIQVHFTAAVDVTGTPTLALNSGATATASYVSGSGSTTLHFTYTVASGDSTPDLDYAGTGALALPGGATIKQTAAPHADAFLTLVAGAPVSLASNAAIIILGTTPSIDHVTSTLANGSYDAGTVVPITVSFSENVTVTGTPQLALAVGAPAGVASYLSGSGGTDLLFDYTVQAGQAASDLQYSGSSLNLNGGSIANSVGTVATLTLPATTSVKSLGGAKDIVIDTSAPAVSSVTGATADGTYGVSSTIDIRITFSEVVVVTGGPKLALNVGQSATYLSGSNSTALIFRYTVQPGDTEPDLDSTSTTALTLNGGTIEDLAGNDANLALPAPGSPGSLGGSSAIAISTMVDTTPPHVQSFASTTPNGTYTDGDVITITATFSEPVAVTGIPFLVLNDIGSSHTTPQANYVSGSGNAVLTFTYTVLAGHSTDVLDCANAGALRLGSGGAIRDAAGNAATLTVPVGGAVGSLASDAAIAVNPSSGTGGKPPPDTAISSESNTGGCGLGSSAGLIAVSLSLLLMRPRLRSQQR